MKSAEYSAGIARAEQPDVPAVCGIVQETIAAVYPRYYPAGAVAYFFVLHSAVRGNHIARLFVLPPFLRRGIGSALLNFAERLIAAVHSKIVIDASFPAKPLYLRRGYADTDFCMVEAGCDFLCYDVMEKPAACINAQA